MAARYIHTCYRILDPEKSQDFYVGKLGMKKVGEMHFDTATNYFFAMTEDATETMLELTHNHGQTEPYEPGDGYSHIAFTVDDLEETVSKLEVEGVEVALQPKMMTVEGDRRGARLQNRLRRRPGRVQGRADRTRHDESRGDHPVVRLYLKALNSYDILTHRNKPT